MMSKEYFIQLQVILMPKEVVALHSVCIHCHLYMYSCIGLKRKIICYQLELENNLPMFRLNALVVIRAKVKKYEQTQLFIGM